MLLCNESNASLSSKSTIHNLSRKSSKTSEYTVQKEGFNLPTLLYPHPKRGIEAAPGSVIYARNKLILPWPNLTINLDLLEEKGS